MLLAELLAFDRAPLVYDGGQRLGHETFELAHDALSMRSYDADRRLHVEVCNVSKATVNPYYGREIPNSEALGLDPARVYMLYRDPEELRKAAPTFARLQLLDLHTAVDAQNPKMERTCGCVGSDTRFEAPYLKASLAIWTQKAIDAVRSRQAAQLSCSYRYDADMTAGTSPDGVAYDGVMRHIIGNHIALVREGRAGPDVYVNDSLPQGLSMKPKYPKILAVIASVIPGLSAAQQLALDTAFDKKARDTDPDPEEAMDTREAACDSREEDMDAKDADPEGEVARGDRKKARDARKAARDKRATDRKGKDSDPTLEAQEKSLKGGEKKGNDGSPSDIVAAVDAAIKGRGYLTRAEAEALAKDAVGAQANLTQAYTDVAPLVGTIAVAMDSAEAVYRLALDHVKVPHLGIDGVAALSAIVAAEVRARKALGNSQPAFDSVSAEFNLDSIFKPGASGSN